MSVSQTSDYGITAICSMPDNQYAVGYIKPAVDVFKLVWNQEHNAARYEKQRNHPVTSDLQCLFKTFTFSFAKNTVKEKKRN